jgi:hypothetical protein
MVSAMDLFPFALERFTLSVNSGGEKFFALPFFTVHRFNAD